jgi:hypothetical protein
MIYLKERYATLHNLLNAYREAPNKEERDAAACLINRVKVVLQ